MPPATEDQVKELRSALEECWNALNDAYWIASSVEAKDTINGCANFISDILDALYIQDIQSRTAALQAKADEIEQGNKKLKKLQDDIDKLISRISTATKVVSAIENVVKLWAFLPI